MAEELERGPAAGEQLTVREKTVAESIERRNAALGVTYRRILAICRPDSPYAQDPLAPLMLAHLCRELVNRLPFVLGTPAVGRDDDEARIGEIAEAWPSRDDGTRGEPSPEALALLAAFVRDRELHSGQSAVVERMIAAQDPARGGHAAGPALRRWADILDLAVGRAHFGKPPELTPLSELRRLGADITDAAYAVLGPFVETTAAIDADVAEVLRQPKPDPESVKRIVGMLATPRQVEHLLEAVPTSWLPTLAAAVKGPRGLFAPPPDTIPVGQDEYRWPSWPAGEYLVRAAPDYPDLAARLAWEARSTSNPLVLFCLVRVLLAVPPEKAAEMLAVCPAWPERKQPASWHSELFAGLGIRLIESRKSRAGFGLLGNVLAPLVAADEPMADHYVGTILKSLSDALLPARAGAYLSFLVGLTRRVLDEDPDLDAASTVWLPRLGSVQRVAGTGHPWRLLNAAYAAGVVAHGAAVARECGGLLVDRFEVTRRLGLALLAAHPAYAPNLVAGVLRQPSVWFRGPFRREFRDVACAALDAVGPRIRAILIGYAAAADEPSEWHAKAKEEGWERADEETYRASWQSQMLGPAAASLTDAERAALSPLFPIKLRDGHEVEVVREPPRTSPINAERIAQMGAEGLASFLAGPEAPGDSEDMYLLNAELQKAVEADPAAWVGFLNELGGMGPRSLYHAILALQGALEKGAQADWASAFDALAEYVSASPDAERLDCARAACRLIMAGTTGQSPTLPADVVPAAVRLAAALLRSADPTAADDARRAEAGSDPLSDSLGFVRSEAVYAASWLLFRLSERGEDRGELERALLDALGREKSPAVWASVGRSLPPLLAGGLSDPDAFVERALGESAEPTRRQLVWTTYLGTCQPFGQVVRRLAAQYASAAAEPEVPTQTHPLGESPRFLLGGHLMRIALWRSLPGADGWVRSFYEGSRPGTANRVSRLLADFLNVDIPEAAGEYILSTLAWRIEIGEARELRSIGWAARSHFRPRQVYQEIVLPAILAPRADGRAPAADDTHAVGTEDEQGAIAAMVAFAAEFPRDTARALHVVLNHDKYGLPGSEGDEIEAILRALLESGDAEVRDVAVVIINELAARRYDRFVGLLPGREG